MIHRRNIIQISLTVFSALLLALLYSPWGSPDLYNKKSYFAENQGVYFQGKIANSSISLNQVYNQSGNIFPEYKKEQNQYTAYNGGGSAKLQSQSRGNMMSGYTGYSNKKTEVGSGSSDGLYQSAGTMQTVFSNRISKRQGVNNIQVSSLQVDLSVLKEIFGAFSKKETSSYLETTLQGFETFTTDISSSGINMSVENESPLQKSNPGDDGVYGEPIPVGEGWIFLIVLVALYAIWKKVKCTRKKLEPVN